MESIAIYEDLETTDIALGTVCAIRMLIELLEEAGTSRETIETKFQERATGLQRDSDTIGAANFLRLAAGIRPKRAGR
jgi:chemotaxis receptor (MCP) glutamine deamidase CheD